MSPFVGGGAREGKKNGLSLHSGQTSSPVWSPDVWRPNSSASCRRKKQRQRCFYIRCDVQAVLGHPSAVIAERIIYVARNYTAFRCVDLPSRVFTWMRDRHTS